MADSASRVHAQQLQKLGIEATEHSLFLHLQAVAGLMNFNEKNTADVKQWLVNLLVANRKYSIFDDTALLHETIRLF